MSHTTHTTLEYLRLKAAAVAFRLALKWRGTDAPDPADDDIEKHPVSIPSRDQGRSIAGYLYHPATYSPSAPPSPSAKKPPILVNWHGSGFVLPNLGQDHPFCARVAREAGIVVLDADYRKSPETPFPGPLHDVEDVLNWVASQVDRFDVSRVAVSGFSAGGCLALVAGSTLRQGFLAAGLDIRAVVTLYAGTDLAADTSAKSVPHSINSAPPRILDIFYDSYVPDRALRTDPRVSPAFADPASFPDTVAILTCSGDTLAPEANALAAKINNGNRKVVNVTLEGVGHGFDKQNLKEGTIEWERRETAYSLICSTLAGALRE